MSLSLVPITLRDACAFIVEHHRHHDPPRGHILTVGAADGARVVGVCVVGRPVARMLQDGYTADVTRLATDGTRNACSFLYGAAWRACRALGYRKLVTYTLPEEGGRRCARLAGSASERLAAARGPCRPGRALIIIHCNGN